MDSLKCLTDLEVGELIEGIKIRSDRSRKENRILRNDSETGSEIVEFDFGDINTINGDGPSTSF